jgi:hypothetical protein
LLLDGWTLACFVGLSRLLATIAEGSAKTFLESFG